MPDTIINISLGVQTITFDDSGAVMPKILNLIQGDNITFESSVDPLDPTKVNVTVNATGGGTPEVTRLILAGLRDFEADPLNDGDSFTVATTMPLGKRIKDLWAKGTDILGTGSPVITFSIEDDAPDFHSVDAGSIDYNGSYSQISITTETTIANRNIIITVTGGDITGGTFDELVCEYIK